MIVRAFLSDRGSHANRGDATQDRPTYGNHLGDRIARARILVAQPRGVTNSLTLCAAESAQSATRPVKPQHGVTGRRLVTDRCRLLHQR
jgi:hypothetical protein